MPDINVPGFTADPALQAKLDNLDDQLEPISNDLKEDDATPPEENKKPSEDKTKAEEKDKQEDKEDDKKQPEKPADEKDDRAKPKADSEEEDEGYAIDEGDEGDPERDKKPETPESPKDEGKARLSPEQQFILDNVSPIVVHGTIGSEDKVQEFKVLSPEQLPQGFKYVDDREQSVANKAFAMLENKAEQLQSDFRNQETQKSTKAFKEAEDSADRSDIAQLQKDGDIPKFKAEPNSPDFAKDPAAELIQSVLDYKEKRNEQYLEEYNAGRPYKHIGFQEAFLMFRRENPVKSDPAQEQEDKERKEIAKRTSGTRGSNAPEVKKPTIHSGMTSLDLEHLIEQKTKGW